MFSVRLYSNERFEIITKQSRSIFTFPSSRLFLKRKGAIANSYALSIDVFIRIIIRLNVREIVDSERTTMWRIRTVISRVLRTRIESLCFGNRNVYRYYLGPRENERRTDGHLDLPKGNNNFRSSISHDGLLLSDPTGRCGYGNIIVCRLWKFVENTRNILGMCASWRMINYYYCCGGARGDASFGRAHAQTARRKNDSKLTTQPERG